MHWVVCSGGELRSVLVLKRHLLLLLWSLAAFGADDQAIQTSHTGGGGRGGSFPFQVGLEKGRGREVLVLPPLPAPLLH